MKNIYTSALCLFLAGAFPADSHAVTDALKIRITQGSYSDEIIIRFMAGATNGFDGCCDAWKLFSGNTSVPNLFTKNNAGNKLSINAMPEFLASHYEDVFLRIRTAGTYSITPSEPGAFAADVCIMMKDLVTGQLYDMRTATIYTVSLPVITVTDPARFRVFFSYPASMQTTGVSCTNCSDGSATITKAGESNWLYSALNSSGNTVASGTATGASETITGLAAGNYTAILTGDYTCAKTVGFTISGPVTYYSRASGNWSNAATWSLDGCGGAAASSPPGAANNVVICAGNNVTLNASTSCMDVTIGGTLKTNAELTLTGNWINTGTFKAGTQKVTFNGIRLQTISGTKATVFNNLTIYNTTPAEALRLNAPITVSGILGLKDGHITTTVKNILTCGPFASVSLLSSPQDSSFIKGPMRHKVKVSYGVIKIFPIGKDNSYRRIDLTIDQKTTALTTYTAEMLNSSAAALNYSLPASISNVSNVRYHKITQSRSTTKLDVAQVRVYFGCTGIDDQVKSLPPISVAKDNGTGSWIDLNDTPNGYSCGSTYWGSTRSGTFTSFKGTKFTLTNTGITAPMRIMLPDFNTLSERNYANVTIENTEPIAVYPNPASEYFNVNISGNKGKESGIVINDMIGRAVFLQTFIPESDHETILVQFGSGYASGIYTVTVSTTQGVYKKKVTIK